MGRMPTVARKSINGLILGEIRPFPFRSTVLAKYGWYYCNGDKYTLASDQGEVLNSFDSQYKSDMGITVASNQINVPKLIYTDGRHYFIRGGATPGVIQGDAIRNITGDTSLELFVPVNNAKSLKPFTTTLRANSYVYSNIANSAWNTVQLGIDISQSVSTANENRPLNFTMVYAIYLGVESA